MSTASRLCAELSMLNLHLPAKVWLPSCNKTHHHIVRIPPTQAVVLNSKMKVDNATYSLIVICFFLNILYYFYIYLVI